MTDKKYNKKTGLKHFRKLIDKARMRATAAQRVEIARAMEGCDCPYSARKMPATVLALARMIPYASRRPAVMKRITRLEKHLFNQRAPTSPLFRPGSGSQPSKSGDSTTSPDANACSSKRPWWEVLGVSPDCDDPHVRKACRAKVLRWIKETGGQRKSIQAIEAFTEIRVAYQKAMWSRRPQRWLSLWDQDAAANDADSDDLSV